MAAQRVQAHPNPVVIENCVTPADCRFDFFRAQDPCNGT
jgi:hypothetical protein